MIEPLIARLVGCGVFAGLFCAMILAVAAPEKPRGRDVVTTVEIQQRVATLLFTRP